MNNHVHLLIEVQKTPLSKIMQGINQSYTMYFNREHGTIGQVMVTRHLRERAGLKKEVEQVIDVLEKGSI